MSDTAVLAIGTRKGLWLATSGDGRASWQLKGPLYTDSSVYAVGIDTRRDTPRLLAGVNNQHFDPIVVTSDDLGATWQEPERAPLAFPEDTEEALARVWQFAPAPAEGDEVVYAGVEPSALFRSGD